MSFRSKMFFLLGSVFCVCLGSYTFGATTAQMINMDTVVQWMYDNGLTKFNTVTDFKPNEEITREQSAKFFVQFRGLLLSNGIITENDGSMPISKKECDSLDFNGIDIVKILNNSEIKSE